MPDFFSEYMPRWGSPEERILIFNDVRTLQRLLTGADGGIKSHQILEFTENHQIKCLTKT
jgi:hypothetical protein